MDNDNTGGKEVRMVNAPYWYGTHLDKLDFEWSREEALEIERYSEKILKNATEEDMTPLERWKAHMAGKPKDRKLICNEPIIIYSTRTLDSYGDILKPIDLMKNPKLMVKAVHATTARFKNDFHSQNVISYTEEIFGGRAKMIDHGNPSAIGDKPIKSLADLEGLEAPDPYSAGLFPGWLWFNRELRRIIDKYKLPLPLWSSIGSDPTSVAMIGILGWTPFLKALITNKELALRCADLGFQWNLKFFKALLDTARPEGMYACQFTGGFPLKGNEWVGDQLRLLAKAVKAFDPQVHLSHGYSFLSGVFDWYKVAYERGGLTKYTFDGGTGGLSEDINMKGVMDWHREHDVYLSYSIPNDTIENGPISRIEEECKALCDLGRSHPRFAPSIIPVWRVPPPYLDAAMAAMRKYSKC